MTMTITRTSRRGLLLAATCAAGVAQAQTAAPAPQAGPGLDEIVVTATKRSENLQNVPISIQAIGNERLEQLNVQEFSDYVKYLPSVSFTSFGPGLSQVYFRGVASGETINHSASLPLVGVYLDEQPVTTIQGALDIHIYDIERVEALAGPQGTLYGASSEAGTLRIITNKPQLNEFEGGIDLQAAAKAHGDPNYTAEGFVNVPVSDNAAIRLVGWYDKNGGFIDNVYGERTFPSSGLTLNNADKVKDDINDNTTYGGRALLRIELNENWTVTPGIMGQIQETDGLYAYDKAFGKLNYSHRFDDNKSDKWWQASLTVEGKIGDWDLTYAFSWLDRKVKVNADYSDYAFYYDACCGYGAYITDNAGNVIDPSQYIVGSDGFTKQSHELRLASPSDRRLRAIGGLFYQRQTDDIEQNYIINNFADVLGVPGTEDNIWLTKQERVDRDYAVFGELSYDVIPDKFTLTAGGRIYRYDNTLIGFFGFGPNFSGSTGVSACFGRVPGVTDGEAVVEGSPCTNLGIYDPATGEIKPRKAEDTGGLWKLNATWRFDEQKLAYFTWSRGYRPGGINRRGSLPPYTADFLTNYELGFKTSWFDRRLRVNGAAYYLKWEDVQFSFLGPNGLTEIQNAQTANVKGFELDAQLAPIAGLTIGFGLSYNDAKLADDFCRVAGTTDCTAPPGNSVSAPSGQQLPYTAPWKGNLNARYEWTMGDWDPYLQGNLSFQTDSFNDLRSGDRAITGVRNGYQLVDLSAGVVKDVWTFELFSKNVFDATPDLYRYAQCATQVCGGKLYTYTTQPRTVGFRIGRRF